MTNTALKIRLVMKFSTFFKPFTRHSGEIWGKYLLMHSVNGRSVECSKKVLKIELLNKERVIASVNKDPTVFVTNYTQQKTRQYDQFYC